ncbi:MAG TPA: hypothetical protein VG389_12580 [Myxococcota bacterium]|jgi:WAS/WASL-interacting protein|nr:hypothetical protein [Myxococcota bacterium]
MPDIRKLLEKGAAFVAKGKLAKALEAYQEACASDPHDPIPLQRQAELLLRTGADDDAVGCYLAAARLYPNVQDAPKAAALYRAVLRVRPDNAIAAAGLAAAEQRGRTVVPARRDVTPVPPARAIAMPQHDGPSGEIEIEHGFRDDLPGLGGAEVRDVGPPPPGGPPAAFSHARTDPTPRPPAPRRPGAGGTVGFEIDEDHDAAVEPPRAPSNIGMHAAPRGPFAPAPAGPAAPPPRLSSFGAFTAPPGSAPSAARRPAAAASAPPPSAARRPAAAASAPPPSAARRSATPPSASPLAARSATPMPRPAPPRAPPHPMAARSDEGAEFPLIDTADVIEIRDVPVEPSPDDFVVEAEPISTDALVEAAIDDAIEKSGLHALPPSDAEPAVDELPPRPTPLPRPAAAAAAAAATTPSSASGHTGEAGVLDLESDIAFAESMLHESGVFGAVEPSGTATPAIPLAAEDDPLAGLDDEDSGPQRRGRR